MGTCNPSASLALTEKPLATVVCNYTDTVYGLVDWTTDTGATITASTGATITFRTTL